LVATMTEDAWSAFWIFVDRPEIVLREEWNTPAKRAGFASVPENLDELRQLTREAFQSKTTAQWEEFLRGQPETIWERVRGHEDVLTDPQNLANDYIVDIDLPVSGRTKTVGSLMAFSDTPTGLPKTAPMLGQHTASILADLGFTNAEIDTATADAESTRGGMLGTLLDDD